MNIFLIDASNNTTKIGRQDISNKFINRSIAVYCDLCILFVRMHRFLLILTTTVILFGHKLNLTKHIKY